MPKFYHDRNTVNFLKELQFVGEFDTIDKTEFYKAERQKAL